MKYEQSVKDLYKIAGMLRLLTCMHERKIPPAMIVELEDAMEKLELIGAEMMEDLLTPEPCLMIKGSGMIDFFDDDDDPETEVSAHEGTEESPPNPQPTNQ